MFKKLQKKILLLNMTLISVVMLLAFTTVYITTWQSVRSENRRKLDTQAPTLVTNLEDEAPSEKSGLTVSHTVSPDYSLSFSIEIDGYGNVLKINSIIDMPEESYAEVVRMALAQGKDSGIIIFSDKEWMYKVGHSSNIQIINGTQTVTQEIRNISFLDVTESRLTMRNLLLILSVVAVGVIIIFYFISMFFSKRAVKPVAESWEKQKQFIADASHELKTPLTIINSNCDALLENRYETVESQIKWLDYIQIGTDRMANLVGQLLVLAKMDDMGGTITRGNVDISNLALDTTRSMEAVAHEKNLKLFHNFEPNIIIKSDSEKIAAVLTILLENATKYADSYINVKLEKVKRHVFFTVKNDGIGISGKDLPKIFDRFYRGDKSRQGNNSFGLGLSIAKTIVENLDGKISVESKMGEYTIFTVVFPT